MLNKRGGAFSEEDESRLRAFTAQISIGLENAKLFNDVENMKNYNESMLQSMSNGVITLDEYANIVTCNDAGLRILQIDSRNIIGRPADEFLTGTNAWVQDKILRVAETRVPDISMDAELEYNGKRVSVNSMSPSAPNRVGLPNTICRSVKRLAKSAIRFPVVRDRLI